MTTTTAEAETKLPLGAKKRKLVETEDAQVKRVRIDGKHLDDIEVSRATVRGQLHTFVEPTTDAFLIAVTVACVQETGEIFLVGLLRAACKDTDEQRRTLAGYLQALRETYADLPATTLLVDGFMGHAHGRLVCKPYPASFVTVSSKTQVEGLQVFNKGLFRVASELLLSSDHLDDEWFEQGRQCAMEVTLDAQRVRLRVRCGDLFRATLLLLGCVSQQ
jgi:hypothetical protein